MPRPRTISNTFEIQLQPDPASDAYALVMVHASGKLAAYFQRCAAVQMARAGVDIIILGDDVAGQQGLLPCYSTDNPKPLPFFWIKQESATRS